MKTSKGARSLWPTFGLALLVGGCAVEVPKAPSTNFIISIPVANDSTSVGELVSDRDDFLELDDAGGMTLRIAIPLTSGVQPPATGCNDGRDILGCEEVGDNLRVTPGTQTFRTAIGDLSIPGQTIPEVEILLSQLLGAEIPTGVPIPGGLPAQPFDQTVPLPLEGVTSLTIVSGGLDLSIDNGFPVALENVRIEILDNGAGGNVVDSADLGTIAAGGSGSGTVSLAGKTVSGDLALRITGRTQGAEEVTLETDPSLIINATLQPLEVSEAVALIPAQEIEDSLVLPLDDRVLVDRAAIEQGRITLIVTNEIPIIMSVSLTLPDLLDADGNPQVFNIPRLSQNAPTDTTFELAGTEFRPSDPTKLKIEYTASTFPTDTEVPIRSDSEIKIEAISEPLVFSIVQGRLNGIQLDLPDQEQTIDFPDGLDNVAISDITLDASITSAVGFTAEISLEFIGTNSFGNVVTLDGSARFEAGNPDSPNPQTIRFAEGLSDFINNLPTHILIRSGISIGGGGEEVQVIEPDHWVSVDSVVFRTAPRLNVLEDTRIDPTVEDISFHDTAMRDKIETNFKNASVSNFIESSIPIGVGIRLYAAHRQEDVYTSPSITIPDLSQPPFQVSAAPVDANGLSVGVALDTVTVELTKEDVLEFILEDNPLSGPPVDFLFSGVRITLPATNGEVEVRATDIVNIISGLQIELELNSHLVD